MKLKTLLVSAMLSVFVGSVASGCTYYKPIVKIHTKQTEISFLFVKKKKLRCTTTTILPN